jgi:hypothetical protein
MFKTTYQYVHPKPDIYPVHPITSCLGSTLILYYLCFDFQVVSLPSCFLTRYLYTFLISPMPSLCALPFLTVTTKISGKEYEDAPHYVGFCILLLLLFFYANIVLSSFPSNTLNMCFPLGITDHISYLYMTLSYNWNKLTWKELICFKIYITFN